MPALCNSYHPYPSAYRSDGDNDNDIYYDEESSGTYRWNVSRDALPSPSSSSFNDHSPSSASTSSLPFFHYPPKSYTSPALPKSSNKPASRQRDPAHIPRPRNSFIVFRSEFIRTHRQVGESRQNELSKLAGVTWKAMSKEEKQRFQEIATAEQVMHKAEHPEYRYRPRVHRKTANGKRTRKTHAAVPSLPVSLCSSPELVGSPEPPFPRLFLAGQLKAEQLDLPMDAMPPALSFGRNDSLFDFNPRSVDAFEILPIFPNIPATYFDYDCMHVPFDLLDTTGLDNSSPFGYNLGHLDYDLNYLTNCSLTLY